MITDARIFEMDDALLADLEGHVAAAVRDRWSTFIFSEDVQIEDVSSSTAQVGVYGPRAADVLAHALGGADAAALQALPPYGSLRLDFQGASARVLRSSDLGVTGFDVVLPLEHKLELQRRLAEDGGITVEPAVADARRIEAGRPAFGIDMTEDTIPLEAGIEDRAISLTKGCYVGQEVIIRVLHRGHGRVARKLVGLTLDDADPVPAAGTRIVSGEREIGRVTSATLSPALGRPIALGYVHRDFVEPGTGVTLAGEKETAATVTPLPFIQ